MRKIMRKSKMPDWESLVPAASPKVAFLCESGEEVCPQSRTRRGGGPLSVYGGHNGTPCLDVFVAFEGINWGHLGRFGPTLREQEGAEHIRSPIHSGNQRHCSFPVFGFVLVLPSLPSSSYLFVSHFA